MASLKKGGGKGGGTPWVQLRVRFFLGGGGAGTYCFIVICACTRRALLGLVFALFAAGFLIPLRSTSSVVDEQHLGP